MGLLNALHITDTFFLLATGIRICLSGSTAERITLRMCRTSPSLCKESKRNFILQRQEGCYCFLKRFSRLPAWYKHIFRQPSSCRRLCCTRSWDPRSKRPEPGESLCRRSTGWKSGRPLIKPHGFDSLHVWRRKPLSGDSRICCVRSKLRDLLPSKAHLGYQKFSILSLRGLGYSKNACDLDEQDLRHKYWDGSKWVDKGALTLIIFRYAFFKPCKKAFDPIESYFGAGSIISGTPYKSRSTSCTSWWASCTIWQESHAATQGSLIRSLELKCDMSLSRAIQLLQ